MYHAQDTRSYLKRSTSQIGLKSEIFIQSCRMLDPLLWGVCHVTVTDLAEIQNVAYAYLVCS